MNIQALKERVLNVTSRLRKPRYTLPTMAIILSLAMPINQAYAVTAEDMINSVSGAYSSIHGFGTIVGYEDPTSGVQTSWGYNGLNDTSLFRVGSQSKMLTSQVMLGLTKDPNYSGQISLDSTIGELIKDPNIAAKLPSNITQISDVTIRDLMNMETNIVDHLRAEIPSGQYAGMTIADASKGAQYQSIGLSTSEMIEYAINTGTSAFPDGYTGQYSNTNALILGLIAEGVTGYDFATVFDNHFNTEGLSSITLESLANPYIYGTTGVDGLVNGNKASTWLPGGTIDPTLPGASGAAYTNMTDILTLIEEVYKQVKQDGIISEENSTKLSLYGIPITYGLGVMGLDMSALGMGDINIYGHGGSVQGSDSFSGWLEANGVNLGGLSVMTNIYGYTATKGGAITNTPGYALYFDLAQQLDRLARSTSENVGINVGDKTINYGPTGGVASEAQQIVDGVLTLGGTDKAYSRIDWDSSSLAFASSKVLDPVLSIYGNGDGYGIQLTANASIVDQANTRVEGYSDPNTYFYLLNFDGPGTTSTLNGQYAVYGDNVRAISTDRALDTASTSLIEAHGDNVTGIILAPSAAGSNLAGNILVGGTATRGLSLNANNVILSGSITATTSGTLFNTNVLDANNIYPPPDAPLKNNATAISVSNNLTGLTITSTANITATTKESGRSYSTASVAVLFVGADSDVTSSGTITSSDYSVYFLGTDNTFEATGGTLTGNIGDENSSRGNKLIATNTTLVGTGLDSPIFANVEDVELINANISWIGDLPEIGETILLADEVANFSTNGVTFLGGTVLAGTITQATGANSSDYSVNFAMSSSSPIESDLYNSFAQATKGKSLGSTFIGDAKNLTPQATMDATLAGISSHTASLATGKPLVVLPQSQRFYRINVPTAQSIGQANSQGMAAGSDFTEFKGVNSALLTEKESTLKTHINFNTFYNDTSYDTDGDFDGYDQETKGAMLGLAFEPNESFIFGPFFGFSDSDTEYKNIDSDAEAKTVTLGFAGAWDKMLTQKLGMTLSGSIAYTSISNDTKRTVLGYATHEASFDQDITSLGAEYALHYYVNDKFTISPAVGLNYMHISQESYEENGLLAINSDAFSEDLWFTTLSLGADYQFYEMNSTTFNLGAKVAWEHYLSDTQFETQARYVGGSDFTALSRPLDKNNLLLGLNVTSSTQFMNMSVLDLTLGYQGRFADTGKEHQVNLMLNYMF